MDQEFKQRYVAVIGLEVHAQLLTHSKAYATDSTEYGSLPNTNISVVTLAHPGTLPRPNRKVIEYALRMGLACRADITPYNLYARKNYFYPDLPKGYQITQDKTPICRGGFVTIDLPEGGTREVRLTRIHMEEDAGKSMHLPGETETLVDYNRAGVPLIEIVSEPDLRSADEAYAYLTEVRRLVRYLDICDGNMEEGSLRCDANVSVMRRGATTFGNKVEVKNMNSISNVRRAINHEIARQIAAVEAGETIVSETRHFNAETGTTHSMRTKEDLNDYRYFPEPDLPPVVVSDAWLDEVRAALPPLPRALYAKFTEAYGLPAYDAGVLTDSKDVALYFDAVCQHTKNYKAASNWVMGALKSYLNERTLPLADFPVSPPQLAALIGLIDAGQVSHQAAGRVFRALTEEPNAEPLALAKQLNLIQESNTDSLLPLIEAVVAKYPDKVAAYRSGKKGLLGMFMGEVMKASRGKADPKVANRLLAETLEKA